MGLNVPCCWTISVLHGSIFPWMQAGRQKFCKIVPSQTLPAEEVPAAVAEAPSHLFNDLAVYPCHISIQVFSEVRTSARISASSIQSSHDLLTESETIQDLQMTQMCANESPIQVVGKFKVLKLQMVFLLLCTTEFDELFSAWKILMSTQKSI